MSLIEKTFTLPANELFNLYSLLALKPHERLIGNPEIVAVYVVNITESAVDNPYITKCCTMAPKPDDDSVLQVYQHTEEPVWFCRVSRATGTGRFMSDSNPSPFKGNRAKKFTIKCVIEDMCLDTATQ